MRVFIVDDSAPVLERLAAVVSELAVTIELVGQAQDAPGAAEAIRRLKPDLVILDLRIPGGGGIHVLREIKQHAPAPIVVILTNYPYPQYRKQCHEAGADFFFDKSMDFDKVPALLQQLARGKSNGNHVSDEPRQCSA
ncbi:MAG TPA: response regulator transcription factor [Verrucomicrobiae bacterium]|nr:response regulator transcription factor [Verrucomicrobiae bacterium]